MNTGLNMQIYSDLEQINIKQATAVALGNFDGLHIGHRKVMEDAVEEGRKRGLKSLCFTFSNHPLNFILDRDESDPAAVKLICNEEAKIELVEELGFDILVNIPFNEEIMKMRAGAFFNGIIAGRLNAGYVSVGFNYTYGARAEGTPASLTEECERSGIGLTIHDAVTVEGRTVSSTMIRRMIGLGDMEGVCICLGRSYSFRGRVAHGRRIGTGNGVPTINIPAPEKQLLPPFGVYFSRIKLGDRIYDSISNIGINPTVNISEVPKATIETFIFDFDDDIYGDDVIVYFDHFWRAEQQFDSREKLYAQIRSDCTNAVRFHEERKRIS